MPVLDNLQVTIKGESINLNDREKFINATLSMSQEKIALDKLRKKQNETDSVISSISGIQHNYIDELQNKLTLLIDLQQNIDKKILLEAVNEVDRKALNLQVINRDLVAPGSLEIEVQQVATNELWISTQFPWQDYPVVYPQSATRKGFMVAGSIAFAVQNNAVALSLPIASSNDVAVVDSSAENAAALFQPGTFYLLDAKETPFPVVLALNDTLENVMEKLSAFSAVAVSVESGEGGTSQLVLRSQKYGQGGAFQVIDPNFIIPQQGFVAYSNPTIDRQSISLSAGDKLSDITQKINQYSSSTGVVATVYSVAGGRGQNYYLQLKSMYPGVSNSFEVFDSGVLFDPTSMTGAVFNGVFSTGGAPAARVYSASDSILSVNGVSVSVPSNILDGSNIPWFQGLSATLKGPTTAPITIYIERELLPLVDKVEECVQLYNDMLDAIAKRAVQATGMPDDIQSILQGFRYVIPAKATGLSFLPSTVGNTAASKLLLDKSQLLDNLEKDFELVQRKLGVFFTSNNNAFFMGNQDRKIQVSLMGRAQATDISFSVQLDGDAVGVLQTVSASFSDGYSSVVDTSHYPSLFSPGTFFISGYPVILRAGQGLYAIASAITEKGQFTGVEANVEQGSNGYFLRLAPYRDTSTGIASKHSMQKFRSMELRDPEQVLNSVFSIGAYSTTGIASASTPIDAIVAGTFQLNGQSITIANSAPKLSDLVTTINAHSSLTGVKAGLTAGYNADSVVIYLTLKVCDTSFSSVSIDDPNAILSPLELTFLNAGLYAKSFYDTSRAAKMVDVSFENLDLYREYLPITIGPFAVESINNLTVVTPNSVVTINGRSINLGIDNSLGGVVSALSAALAGVLTVHLELLSFGSYMIVLVPNASGKITMDLSNNPFMAAEIVTARLLELDVNYQPHNWPSDSSGELEVLNIYPSAFQIRNGVLFYDGSTKNSSSLQTAAIEIADGFFVEMLRNMARLKQLLEAEYKGVGASSEDLPDQIKNAEKALEAVRQRLEASYSKVVSLQEVGEIFTDVAVDILQPNRKKDK